MDKETLAREAARLRDDPVLRDAIAAIRAEAVERIIRADASTPANIIELQALARACDRIPSELERMIKSSQGRKAPHAV